MTLRPSAQGSLAKTPFAHLLLYTYGRQLSGTLAVWPDSGQDNATGQDRLLFHGGTIVALRPMRASNEAYAALLPLFQRRDAVYGFYEGQNLLGTSSGVITQRVDPYTLLARGTRTQLREDLMDGVLSRLQGRPLRMRAGVPVERLEFGPKERALIEVLRAAPATPEGLITAAELPPLEAKRVLYLLVLIRGVEAAEASSPPSRDYTGPVARAQLDQTGSVRKPFDGLPRATLSDTGLNSLTPPSMSSLPPVSVPAPQAAEATPLPSMPPGLSEQDATRWNELTQLYGRLDTLTHFDLLGVARNASASDVSAAYFGLVKKFHPDRLSASLAPLAPMAQTLFERLTEASETLNNPETRAEYGKAVESGGGTRAAERMMRDVLESAVEFQKAEVLAKRRDYPQAMQLIRSALAKNPDEADYHAFYAWLLNLMHPADSAYTQEILRELDRALQLHPRNERAHYYRGVVLKRLNRGHEALHHFRTAAQINPRNVDAAREVRLAVMRKDSKAPPPSSASSSGRILSRLFGSKDE